MSIINFRRKGEGGSVLKGARSFFESPQPAGRKITAGFSYLQRIGKAASFDVWFPYSFGKGCAQWAAVRQFELLQESGNHKIYDLDPLNLQRSMLDLSRSMRAGGYRITVATLGVYCEGSEGDELKILDATLQEDIENIIHMLYLDEASKEVSSLNAKRLADKTWDFKEVLPHVGATLGACELFNAKRKKISSGDESGSKIILARKFFEALERLPNKHIVHDTAIGLQLPELTGRNQWNYIASPEETLAAFNHVLSSLFDKFNGISLSRLNGRSDATSEIKASVLHLRGYGDRLNERSENLLKASALAFG